MKGLFLEKKIFLSKKFKYLLSVLFVFNIIASPLTASAQAQVVTALASGIVSAVTGGGIFDIFQIATEPLFAAIGLALLEVGAFIVGLAGNILDGTINHTLVLMSHYVSNITGITIAWGVIRDLINMSFIFILLYIAIGTILGLSGVNWKKTLEQIVVAAILINFSLFFTKVIIDASNLLALTFYSQLTGTTGTISGEFVNSLNLTTLYFDPNNNALTGHAVFLIGIMGSIFLLITAIAFLIASFLFLSRFVTFIFLLILSPIGFFGSVLPGLSQYAKQWRDTLFGQALFAPIYMILTWVSLRIMSDPQFLPNSKATLSNKVSYVDVISKTQVTNGAVNIAPGAFDIFINFIVVIMFMLATIIISKKAASQGSTYGQKLVGGAFGLGVAGAGFAGRNTLGRIGMRMARSDSLKEKADSGSVSARLALRASNYAAKSSFDVRGSKTIQSINKFGKATEIGGLENFGLGGKGSGSGGVAKSREDRIKNLQKQYEERAKMYGANTESEKELLRNKRSEEESRLKAELEAIGRGENLSTSDKSKLDSIEAQIAQLEKDAREQEELANDTSIPLAEEQRTSALEEAERLKKLVEDHKEEKLEVIINAQKQIREELENIGVKDETKTFEDKKAREKYEKEIEQKKKDFESGQGRVKREAERIASGWGLFSAKEAKKKALDKIKKGGDKKPEDIFKEAVEKANEAAKASESNETEAKEGESKSEKPTEGSK